MRTKPSIAYVIDPRFSGGTSAAVASEIEALNRDYQIKIFAVSSKMFRGKSVAPQLRTVLAKLRLELIWDAPQISADIVLVHNPSFLKFQDELNTRIIARHLIVITHENFLRPGNTEAFDVAKCLNILDRSSLALSKSIAPISAHNRKTVLEWLKTNQPLGNWSTLKKDWFNICDFTMEPPTKHPTDRRGRHSRPGLEKYPSLSDMDLCFPAHTKSNVILGADLFIRDNLIRPHWEMHPFNGISVAQYFDAIDFMVYYTIPTLRESFGRVLAEAIAAGKVVLSDPETASGFQGAVLPAHPEEVDRIISELVENPGRYRDQVLKSQNILKTFSSVEFQQRFQSMLNK